MAHFARIRNIGAWTALAVPLSSEHELFDAHQFAAINGDGGGTWAPTTQIIIGGQGMRVTGICQLDHMRGSTIDGTVSVDGGSIRVVSGTGISVRTGATAEWQADSIANFLDGSTVNLNGDFLASGATLVFSDSTFAQFTGAGTILDIASDAVLQFSNGSELTMAAGSVGTLLGGYTFGDGTSPNTIGAVQFNGNVTVNTTSELLLGGDTFRSGALELQGAGATTAWRTGATANANTPSYDTSVDSWMIPAGITANRVYTIDDPAANGLRLRFRRPSNSGFTVELRRDDATLIGTFDNVGNPGWAEVISVGSAWVIEAWGGDFTPYA